MNVYFVIMRHMDCWRLSYRDDITVAFNDIMTLSDVNLKYGVRFVHYNQCISNTWTFSSNILPWVG